MRSNNHFGIKCKRNWTGEKVYHDDDAKGECFRAYPSVEASIRTTPSSSTRSPATTRFALFAYRPNDYKAGHGV